MIEVEGGGGRIASSVPSLESDQGRLVNIGIRPEDMEITEDADFAVASKVDLHEALGEVTLLYMEKRSGEAESVVAKLPGIHVDMRHTDLRFTAQPNKVHIFADGVSLLYR